MSMFSKAGSSISHAVSGGSNPLSGGIKTAFGGVNGATTQIGRASVQPFVSGNTERKIGQAFTDPSKAISQPANITDPWSRGFHGGWKGGLKGGGAGAGEGALAGGLAGAAIGSIIPGVGTVIGGGVGAGIGGAAGGISGAIQGARGHDWTAGGENDPVAGGQSARKQTEANDAASDDARQLAGQQNALIGEMRSQYASPQLVAMRQQQQQAQQLAAQQQANTAFGGGLTQNRIAAARSGQLGGSTDQTGQNDLLAQYYQTVAQGAGNAANAGINFDQQMQKQKAAQEAAVRGAANPNDLAGMHTDLASLLNAASRGQITSNALGAALPQLVNAGSNYALTQRMG